MLINEQRECGNLLINTTVNYNSANNGENVLIYSIIRAVVHKVCPDPARRQQCITAPTVSHNTVIAVITACDLHTCSACVHLWKDPNCPWEDYNILLSSHFDRRAERDSDTTPRVLWNNKTTEFMKTRFICNWCAEGTTAAYGVPACGPSSSASSEFR